MMTNNAIFSSNDLVAEPNNLYVLSGEKIKITLPVKASVGSVLRIYALPETKFRICQNEGQRMTMTRFNKFRRSTVKTAIGVKGYMETVDTGQGIDLVCESIDRWIPVVILGEYKVRKGR